MKFRSLEFLFLFLINFTLYSESPTLETAGFLKRINIKNNEHCFYLQKVEGTDPYYKIVKFLNNNSEDTLINGNVFYFSEESIDEKNIFDYMECKEPLFLKKSNFFQNYSASNLCRQLETSRIVNTHYFIADVDKDSSDELINLGYPNTGSNPSGMSIYKFIEETWKEVFAECYFGWEDFYAADNYKEEEWYLPKSFPYDFVEYKGKLGLRIICYDQPKDNPSHYHAQFWAYDEDSQKYEMLEEIYEDRADTPPDGLIFAEASADLFVNVD